MDSSWLTLLLAGFAIDIASAFTTAYSRLLGDRGGRIATALLRNAVGIPLWVMGLVGAVGSPSSALFAPSAASRIAGGLLLAVGSVLQIVAVTVLRRRAAAPSVHDTLVRHGIYGHMRHPIYAGALLDFLGVVLLQPRLSVLIACVLGIGWALLQAKAEEVDLLQRLPEYRDYMREVPRFVPRFWPGRRGPDGGTR